MSMLRAKQIKLAAQGDLLIGGVNGAGISLAKGTAGHVLKATANGLEYNTLAATEISYAAGSVSDALGTLTSDLGGINTRLGTAEGTLAAAVSASGLESDGTLAAFTGTNYLNSSTTLKAASIALDTQLKTVANAVAAIDLSGIADVQGEVDTIETSIGLNSDGTLTAFSGSYTNGVTTVVGAVNALDTQLGTLSNTVNNLVGLSALNFAGEVAGDAATTPVGATQGDVYRIITTGATDWASTGLEVNVGDFVAYAGTSGEPAEPVWVKFDNTDPGISVVGGETSLTVTGNAHAGYTIGLTKANITSSTTAITVTGGTNAVLSAVAIDFDASQIDLTDLAGTLSVAKGGTGLTALGSAGQVLSVNTAGDALEYTYVGALKDSAGANAVSVVGIGASAKLEATNVTVAGDTDATLTTKGYVDAKISAAVSAGATEQVEYEVAVTSGTAAANFVITLTATPVGEVAVYFNGIKLRKTGYTVSGTTVTLVDSVNGYAAEDGDVLNVSYLALAA